MRQRLKIFAVLSLAASTLVGWTALHLELEDSFPSADSAVAEAPEEIWLRFSVAPDMARTSFSVRGPDGNLELSAVTAGDAPEVITATVEGPMPPGSYTLSWAGAPADDHVVRGRYTFSVEAGR
ncbi:MAG: copper resistance protein CopC [Longimicrobiales bacterium]